jgi:hypothetical protein
VFASTVLSVVLTLVFAVTGVYSLVRLARLLADGGAGGDRLVELFHLVMSLGMIAMAWAWTGGPTTAGGVLQIVAFGAFTVWFAHRITIRASAHGRLANGYHLATGAAMTWMLAAMPLMMGAPEGMQTSSGHAGHAGSGDDMSAMAGMDHSTTATSAPAWMVVVSLIFVVLLLAAAGWWALRAVRADDPAPEQDLVSPRVSGSVAVIRTSSTSTVRTPSALMVRTDAGCHMLMSLGMTVMLVAMV